MAEKKADLSVELMADLKEAMMAGQKVGTSVDKWVG